MDIEPTNNITNIGIYEIRCIINDKIYIGSSKNIKKRVKQHLSNLRKNKHCNRYLQFAWNKYGEKMFKFSCLENLNYDTSEEQLMLTEQKYLDKLQTWNHDRGYNISNVADKPPTGSGKNNSHYGKKHTEEAKAKMRGPRPLFSLVNKGKTMKQRLNNKEWVSPNILPQLITLKHNDGSCKSLTRYEWTTHVKVDVNGLKRGSQRTSRGWSLF